MAKPVLIVTVRNLRRGDRVVDRTTGELHYEVLDVYAGSIRVSVVDTNSYYHSFKHGGAQIAIAPRDVRDV